jgi:hypothetical protein
LVQHKFIEMREIERIGEREKQRWGKEERGGKW